MSKPDLAGMTVNERLFVMNLFEKWDAAVHARDREAMLAIIRQVEIIAPEPTVDAILRNTAMYGF